ncbi:MAG: ATP-binding protein [Alcanivorax sp.]|jgi:hypothetical protein
MDAAVDDADIERNFEDIPGDKITEAEQTAFLMDLGWHTGSTWEDLLKSKRILIISEAGAGKTYECRKQQRALWSRGEPAFYVELADLARSSLSENLSHEEEIRFDTWKAEQSGVATFFLDSIDELNLSRGSFEKALKRLGKAVSGRLGRVRVIVTSRPIPIDEQVFRQVLPVPDEPVNSDALENVAADEEFADSVMELRTQKTSEKESTEEWRNVALLPLSSAQIEKMAIGEGVSNPDELISSIRKRNAGEFVRRPQDLIELCADWKEEHRIRSHLDQVASNIVVKLKPRTDRLERAELSGDKALEGASRLALAATLTRKLTLRHSAEADREGDPAEAALDPSVILHDWTQDERTTLLERPLFGFASYGRVRFHHRSVIEYLAAKHLLTLRGRSMSIRSIKRMLTTETVQGDTVVKPTLRPVSAWIALRDDHIFEELLLQEPDILLNFGDPESLSGLQRRRALRAYVERHGKGKWRGLHVPSIQLHRFAAVDLEPEVKHLWSVGIENPEVREILLDLMGLGEMTGCADVAYSIVIDADAPEQERIHALDALVHLNDPRLTEIAESLSEDVKVWPKKITKAGLMLLFPKKLSVELLCKILPRVPESRNVIGEISWGLPRLIESCDLSIERLHALRENLTALVLEDVQWDKKLWPHLVSKRQFLLPVLAATCLRLVQTATMTPELARSAVIALRLTERNYDRTDPAKRLEASFSDLHADVRRILFESEDALLQEHNPQSNALKRFLQLTSSGAAMSLRPTDSTWLLPLIADSGRPISDRAMALEAAIRLRDEHIEWEDHLSDLKPGVADVPELVAYLDEIAQPREPTALEIRWQKEDAKRKKQSERRRAKARASWIIFWRELASTPSTLFSSDRRKNTVWNLWNAMERGAEDSSVSGWNRRFIERHLGVQVADRLRLSLMEAWRTDLPTLRSERPKEEKERFLVRWRLGLAGIAAEAEDPHWAEKLKAGEPELALRYAPIELNGFPAWLETLSAVHPKAVDDVLGEELTAELNEPPSGHSSMLQKVCYAEPSVGRLFTARLFAWLYTGKWRSGCEHDEAARVTQLRQVIQALMEQGDVDTYTQMRALARDELRQGAKGATGSIWLPTLMRLDPDDGVDALERTLHACPVEKSGPASNWFGALFGATREEGCVSLTSSAFTPTLLLRLARLSYQYVRPSDDIVREGGSYTPTARDHAEHARSNIIYALLSGSGAESWAIKTKLIDDPLFAEFKDRALAIARESSAQQADAVVFKEADVVSLIRCGELPPMSRDEMFALLSDRLDDIEDMLLRDESPRAVWALVNTESMLRQLIARELRLNANRAYKVDQEAVTAEEKETDIRLRSTGSEHEAVIELKIGEKGRSVAELKRAINKQLVAKYMAPETRRAGCLLITVNSSRFWKDPDTGARLDLQGLMVVLKAEANRIEEEMGGAVRLMVRGLDLRPRLPTEISDPDK